MTLDTLTTSTAEVRREAARRRSEDYRQRRRRGCLVASVEVGRPVLHALERLGLLPAGERDPAAVGDAVATFLCCAPGVVLIGEGLFPAPTNGSDGNAG